MKTKLFVGLDQPRMARFFEHCFISINRIRTRRSCFDVREWILDSGAFTEVAKHGGYRHDVKEYAAQIDRWADNGTLLAAVAQDFMCEPFVLSMTGLSIAEHQRLTVERFDALRECGPRAYVMPVLQGYAVDDYRRHLTAYGERLAPEAWVGVGSICKRNGTPREIERVLAAIHAERPDLRLHGFGVKATSLASGLVQEYLATADSMAWSFHARRNGLNQHDWKTAEHWRARIAARPVQRPLFKREVFA